MTTETTSQAQGTEPVRPVSDADRTWATLARELTPAQSLQRMDTATDRVVRTVTIIGTLLGGFGVFGATKPTVSGPARWITVGAVVCAAAAVACALAAQILTISKHVNPENLAQVRAWYKRRLETRGYHRPGAGQRDGHPGHRRDGDPDADRDRPARHRGGHRAGPRRHRAVPVQPGHRLRAAHADLRPGQPLSSARQAARQPASQAPAPS